jgi:hypothetical protein
MLTSAIVVAAFGLVAVLALVLLVALFRVSGWSAAPADGAEADPKDG